VTNPYIRFEHMGDSASGKTSEWDVLSIRRGLEPLGTIRWFGRWRQYAFFPADDTLFNPECMEAISAFIRDRMKERQRQVGVGRGPDAPMNSRDTEIERIGALLHRHCFASPGMENGPCDHSTRHSAAALYDAGLRSTPDEAAFLRGYDTGYKIAADRASQPASEPSLDVERLARALAKGWTPSAEGESFSGWLKTLAAAVAAEYHRLSQPADT